MREAVAQLGPQRSLIGIVTEPSQGVAPNGLGVLFLNAGFTHRVGPQRMYVRLARRLSQLGFTALRLDYSGIGDSRPRTDRVPFARSAVDEAKLALDWLQSTRRIERFLSIGLCWGADNGVRLALADPRVIGIAPIDFYAVPSPRFLARVCASRLGQLRSWINLIRGSSRALLAIRGLVAGKTEEPSDDVLPVQSPSQIVADLRRLVEREVDICFALATGGESYDQYVRHFGPGLRSLRGKDRVRVGVFRADHVFTLLHTQAELVEFLVQWAREVVAKRGSVCS